MNGGPRSTRRVLLATALLSAVLAPGCAPIHAGMDREAIQSRVDAAVSRGMDRESVTRHVSELAWAEQDSVTNQGRDTFVYLRPGLWHNGRIWLEFDPDDRLIEYRVILHGPAWP